MLMFLIALPLVLFVFFFSKAGIGTSFIRFTRANMSLSYNAMSLAMLLLFVAYMLDFSYWKEHAGEIMARRMLVILCSALFGFAAVFGTERYPTAPIGFYMLGMPCYFFGIKKVLFSNVGEHHYLRTLGVVLKVFGSICSITWVLWVWNVAGFHGIVGNGLTEDRQWRDPNKVEFACELRCDLKVANEAIIGLGVDADGKDAFGLVVGWKEFAEGNKSDLQVSAIPF